MNPFDAIKVSDHTRLNGTREVWGFIRHRDAEGKWHDAGVLMPQMSDSRQQPKSLAHKLLEERYLNECWHKLLGDDRESTWRPNLNTVAFNRLDGDGAECFDRYTGQPLGTIMPTVPPEYLQYGIQSWSKPQ